MYKSPFYIVDVFAEKKYSGNQLAVISNANIISENEMQQIALEMNYSETTFILSDIPTDGGYDVRIFTPGEEIPFAGHPTLGTAFIIKEKIIKKDIDKVILNLKAGQIPVTFHKQHDRTTLWMKQNEPDFGKILEPGLLSEMLNISIDDFDPNYPIQEVSIGLPFVIVPLKKLDALRKSRINRDIYFNYIEDARAKGILVFCPEGYEKHFDLSVRVFVDCFGIPEDPATGSGNGCLAAYLTKHSYFKIDIIEKTVAQGFEINRPSTIYIKSYLKDEKINIYVGGGVINIAEGFLE